MRRVLQTKPQRSNLSPTPTTPSVRRPFSQLVSNHDVGIQSARTHASDHFPHSPAQTAGVCIHSKVSHHSGQGRFPRICLEVCATPNLPHVERTASSTQRGCTTADESVPPRHRTPHSRNHSASAATRYLLPPRSRLDLLAVVGSGGMGIRVRSPTQGKLQRRVAIRRFAGKHSPNPSSATLPPPSRSIANCKTPNIIQVFEVGLLDRPSVRRTPVRSSPLEFVRWRVR